jgi:hypothetical protein
MEIEMLQEDRLRTWCGRLRMPAGAIEALVEMARQIQADEKLYQLFAAFYEKTSLRGKWHQDWGDFPMDPAVVNQLGERRATLFYVVGYLAALPHISREYRRLGISREILVDTLYDITLWLIYAYEVHGEWSFYQFPWISRHVECRLFRLGRLQFALEPFEGRIMAFKHRSSGHILLLGDPTTPLRADGYAEGAGGTPPAEDERWFATFEATPAGWRGNRLAPSGYTLRENVFLLRSEWEPVLKHGDTILDLHIPRGEKMTVESCRESIARAFAFFPEHWPERPFKGVFCHTWFFTPQLQQILPPESNIVKFQREFYLYPHPGSPAFLWNFVFGEKYPDAATAPHDTLLRQSILDWLAAGKELFDLPGVMLHSPDQWGTQPYHYAKEPVITEQPVTQDWLENEPEEDSELDPL